MSSELPNESPRHHNRTVIKLIFSNNFLLIGVFCLAQFFYNISTDINVAVEYLSFIGRLANDSSKVKNAIPFEQHYFNADASDGLAIDRDVPDTRHNMYVCYS